MSMASNAWVITLLWAILCYVFYRVGRSEGVDEGLNSTLEVLENDNIIQIDEEGNISPVCPTSLGKTSENPRKLRSSTEPL